MLEVDYEGGGVVTAVSITPTDSITITITTRNESLLEELNTKLYACQKCVATFRMDTWAKDRLYNQLPAIIEKPALLQAYQLLLTQTQLQALAEIVTEAGHHRTPTRSSTNEMILLWNNHESPDVTYQWHGLTDFLQRANMQHGPLPKSGMFTLSDEMIRYHAGNQQNQYLPDKWRLILRYADFLTVNQES